MLSLFNLLLALSLLFSLTSAAPIPTRLDDVSFRPEPKVVERYAQPSTGRLHARSFHIDTVPSRTHLKRDLPTEARDEPRRSHVAKKNLPHFPAMENSLRGKTKVYSGNYWRRKVYHL
jgi:hypothetical protein